MSTSKGIHVATEKLMYDVIPDALGRNQPAAFLSGPSFAKEMMQNFPTTVVVASVDVEIATTIQHMLSQTTFRVYSTTDVIGLEIGADACRTTGHEGARVASPPSRTRTARRQGHARRCTQEPTGHRRWHH